MNRLALLVAFSVLVLQSLAAQDSPNPAPAETPAEPAPEPKIPEVDKSNEPTPTNLDTFDERRAAVLKVSAEDGSDKFRRAECLFELGRKDEAIAEVNKALDPLVPGNKINRWMHGGNTGFLAWPGIDCYIRYEKFLDAATKERYRKIYTGGVFYARLSTSNHKIMAAMTRYLATQMWGADAFHADPYFMAKDPYIIEMTQKSKGEPADYVWGTLFTKQDPTGEKYLRDIIESTVKGGPGEYASRPYGAQNVLPLLTLADCAKDPVMAAQARIAYETCLIQVAPAWLRGLLATFAPRSYPDTENQHPWGYAALPWLYFGGVAPKLSHAQSAGAAAISTYRLPDAVLKAATDRAKPYFYRSRMDGWALNHYMNSNYCLFSRSAKVGGRPFQGQSYPCGVMWEEPDSSKGSHLWITNPAADVAGQMGIHTHGVRSFEEEVLGRDSLLFLFQMTPTTTFPYALGYVPGGYRAMINDSKTTGHVFLNYGSVLIAVTASEPFTWDPAAGIQAPASTPRQGDSEFRVKSLSCAVVIETARPAEFPGATPDEQLQKFREAVLTKSSLKLTPNQPSTASYTNRLGDSIECTWNGADRVNGTELDYKNWPILESPWTNQKLDAGPMEVTDGKTVRTYDFTNWTITEK